VQLGKETDQVLQGSHLIEPLDRGVRIVLGLELNLNILPVAPIDSDERLIGAHQGGHFGHSNLSRPIG
jgi:hypothetical protein